MTKQWQRVCIVAVLVLVGSGCVETPNPYASPPDPSAIRIDGGEKSPQSEPPKISDTPARVVTLGEKLRVQGTIRFAADYSDWGGCVLKIDSLDALPVTASSGTCEKLTEVADHVYEYTIELEGPRKPGKYRLDVLCVQASPKYVYSELLEVRKAK
ncbi:MAG: hypothetical protein U0939_20505 [Pirellulales bacterium]